MSRSFTPPDTMSKDDIRTVADVRRAIWTNGFVGLAAGSTAGYALHSIARQVQHYVGPKRQPIPAVRFTRNTALLSIMAGGALGSFVMATAAGKNSVHELHPVYERGKKDVVSDKAGDAAARGAVGGGMTPYQQAHIRALEDQAAAAAATEREQRDEDKRRRLERRKSIQERIINPRAGLSNSHGGTWYRDEEEDHHGRIEARRAAARERMEHGHGLSNSHGASWYRDEEEDHVGRIEKRRAAARERFETGHGLSNSHGGHWAEETEAGKDGAVRG